MMNLNFKILCRFNFKFCTCQHIPSRHVLFNNWPKTFTNMSLSFVVLRKSCVYEQGLKKLRYLWVPGVGSLNVGAQVVPDGARCGQLLPEGLRCRRQIVPRMIPDAASQDAAICCPMLPGAARSWQMFPDATRQSQIVADATNIVAITNTIPGAYTNANANHHHTNTNINTSNYQYHDHHIAKPFFASRLSALYRDVPPVACTTTMMMGGQPHIRWPSLIIIIDCMQGSSSRLVQALRRRVGKSRSHDKVFNNNVSDVESVKPDWQLLFLHAKTP